MGVPNRFAVEYPARALELIGLVEEQARERRLLGSFGLLAAAAVLTIPYERMKALHFLDRQRAHGPALEIAKLKKVKFLSAPFWREEAPGEWGQSRIMGSFENVDDWKDEKGRPSLSGGANTIERRKADEVVRVLRNALAHGNIIYLDKDRREIVGNPMVYMAFLSRYEESEEDQKRSETYRVVVTSEEEFLRFVKAWAKWVSGFAFDYAVREAA